VAAAAESIECLPFDPTDAFPTESESIGDLLQSVLTTVDKPVSQFEHVAFALVQRCESGVRLPRCLFFPYAGVRRRPADVR
jgi:hypothetical protein